MWRFIFWGCVWASQTAFGQSILVEGNVVDAISGQPLSSVSVSIQNSPYQTNSDEDGWFKITAIDLPLGEQVLIVEKDQFISKRIPITIHGGRTLKLESILMQVDLKAVEAGIGIISLTDDQLNEDGGDAFNMAGLLQASRDVFLNTAAFEFSATFFRPRGLDNANGKILINGIEMNKQFDGRPQWANWGGLNDVQRNREFSMGLKANDYGFGDLAGTSYINMRASLYRKGGRLSYAFANRSYQARIMATYSSGLTKSGWAYALSMSGRYGVQGFVDGNPYHATSIFAAVEKKIGKDHSLNFTAFYTPNTRGRSNAVTQEVRDLRDISYNPNWGFQNGDRRNSRMRRVEEPVFMLNHFWDLSKRTRLNTNIGYRFGKTGTSRIDNGGTRLVQIDGQDTYLGGGRNPLPNYYQRMPSYFLRNKNPSPYDFQLAYQARQEFVQDGQVDWEGLYRANSLAVATGGNAIYVIQEDRTDEHMFTMNTIFNTALTEHIRLTANLAYRFSRSENFAALKDLLGGTGYLDVDFFAEDDVNVVVGDLAQSDLQNRNRIALEGERYKYNYRLNATVLSGFAQLQFKYKKFDFYLAAQFGQTGYQRTGLYENGNFPGARSLGPGPKLNFTTYGGKLGGLYRIKGRHFMDANLGYFTKAPYLRNSYGNARQNNDVIIGLEAEKIHSADLSYIYSSPIVKARVTGYYIGIEDQTDLGFYFTENISGLGPHQDAFIQEVTTGIHTRRMGTELGLEGQLTATVKLRAAAAVGQYVYANNPKLYITSDDFEAALTFGDGITKLQDYHVAGGPEQAFNLAFEYRDPAFWWFGLSGNHYRNAYIAVNKLARTANFTSDFDSQPFNDYDEAVAKELLKQEKFDSYYLLNLAAGKSWRVSSYYVGFFATINNILNQEYVTGGFEQGRYAKYRDMQTDQNRPYGALFGPRYFFGYGTTYYLNLYLRF